MAKATDKSHRNKKSMYLIHFVLFIVLIFTQINIFTCETCTWESKISTSSSSTSCFNEIIKFKNHYRSGQFSIRKDGVLLVEFSSGGKRLFYGLNPNGRGYFNDETNKIISEIGSVSHNRNDEGKESTNVRYESKNMLVTMNNGNPKQYILSISTYYALAELHDIDNDRYKIWLATDFLNISDDKRYVFSYQFSLLRKDNSDIYYAAYVQFKGKHSDGKAYSVSYTLSRFTFSNLESRSMKTQEFSDNYDNRIVSAFIHEANNHLCVFFYKDGTNAYYLRVHNLETLAQIGDDHFVYGLGDTVNIAKGKGVYFKAIYLRFEYAAFIFFDNDNGNKLRFRVYYIKNDYSKFSKKIGKDWNNWGFNTDLTLSEFYMIDVEKFLFVTTQNKKLVLFFLDTENWYSHLTIRTYLFDLSGFSFKMDMAVDYYNNFLMLTTTLNEGDTFYGVLLFFSYPNGTDFYMNISPYVKNQTIM